MHRLPLITNLNLAREFPSRTLRSILPGVLLVSFLLQSSIVFPIACVCVLSRHSRRSRSWVGVSIERELLCIKMNRYIGWTKAKCAWLTMSIVRDSKYYDSPKMVLFFVLLNLPFRMWWTLTGNYGNILPIDWSKSMTRRLHLPTLQLHERPVLK